MTMKKHIEASVTHNSKKMGGMAVVLLDLEGNEIRRESSARRLSSQLGLSNCAVKRAIANGGILKGVYRAKWAKDLAKNRPEPKSSMEKKK